MNVCLGAKGAHVSGLNTHAVPGSKYQATFDSTSKRGKGECVDVFCLFVLVGFRGHFAGLKVIINNFIIF